MAEPARGEVWLASLDPVAGHEQGGQRPVLVLSNDRYNGGGSGLVVVLPITTRWRGIALHVRVPAPEGGLRRDSTVLCDAIRSISRERLTECWGSVSEPTLAAVAQRVRVLLDL